VPVAQIAQALQERGLRRMHAALPLHRLHDDGAHVIAYGFRRAVEVVEGCDANTR
jgi:hypothetical protein